MKGVEPDTNTLLVTNDEQTAKLFEVLGARFTNHGQLLLPNSDLYEKLSDDEGLQALAKELYRWLGYKPHSLDVVYGASQSPTTTSLKKIIVDEQYRNHPLVVGGLVTLAVLRQVMTKHHYGADEHFIENASIQAGLGLWIINAFKPHASHHESLYHMLDGGWLQHEGLQLDAFTKGQYLQEFAIFTSQHRLFPEDYLRGVSKRSHYLLPTTTGTDKVAPLPEPTATSKHLRAAKLMWAKLAIIAITLSLIITFGLVLWAGTEKAPNADQARDEKALSVIKTSLDDCVKHASDQLSTLDPNDLFMARQSDATKSRCESLRNQYNEALDAYQDAYLKQN